jgi:hypothetical protein
MLVAMVVVVAVDGGGGNGGGVGVATFGSSSSLPSSPSFFFSNPGGASYMKLTACRLTAMSDSAFPMSAYLQGERNAVGLSHLALGRAPVSA